MPGFDDRVWQAGAIIAGQTQRRLCCRLRFQRVTLHCHAPGSRLGKSRRVGTPDLSQRLSSKSMAISETPILHRVMINRWYSDVYANRPEDRGGRKPSKCPESATPILRTVLHPSRYQALLRSDRGQVLGRHCHLPPCGHPPGPHRESEPS